jgi:hypothetical protein
VVRGSGNNVRTAPITTLVYTKYIVMRALQSSRTLNHFTKDLLHGDRCPSHRAFGPIDASAFILRSLAQ